MDEKPNNSETFTFTYDADGKLIRLMHQESALKRDQHLEVDYLHPARYEIFFMDYPMLAKLLCRVAGWLLGLAMRNSQWHRDRLTKKVDKILSERLSTDER